ncbi:MFS transporter [Chloroflexota bacterium]
MAHFAHHLINALPVPLLPMIRNDFSLDYTQSGFVISAFSLAYGIAQLPAGWLTDRTGPRLMITIGICGVAAAGLFVGLSLNYFMLIAFLILMGLLGGGYHPSAPSLISASVEPKKRGRSLGFHMIGGSASFFLAPLIAAAIAATWDWRGAFIGLAVPAIIFGFIFFVRMGHLKPTRQSEPKINITYTEKPPAPGRLRRLAVFITLSTTTQAMVLAVTAFIPLFLVDHFGAAEETAAALISLIYVAGFWAGPLGGYLSDRWGRIPVLLTVCFMAGPFIYLLNLAPYGVGFGSLLVAMGIVQYVRMPVSEAYIIDHTSERNRSTIFGIYYFGSLEGSGVLTPILGYLIDRFGFYSSFTIVGAATLAITTACAILLRDSRDKPKATQL